MYKKQKFVFKDFAPAIFERIRLFNGVTNETYLESMVPEKLLQSILESQKFSEGRSGSFFVFTNDKKFILKTVPKNEAQVLMKILPYYYKHLKRETNSFLIRIFGLVSMSMDHGMEIFVMIMANAFNTNNTIHEKYDLKGSWVRRCVGEKHIKDPSILGLDLDLKRSKRKLLLNLIDKQLFCKQIRSDADVNQAFPFPFSFFF